MKYKKIFFTNKRDLDYMSSLNAAAKKTVTNGSRLFLWSISFMFFGTIIWMNFAEIDEITKGDGKVIPSTHLQVVQNLDGGIIKELLVKEGDVVKKNDLLIKLSDVKPFSEFEENRIKYGELKAKIKRLEAEASLSKFNVTEQERKELAEYLPHEEAIYSSNKSQLLNKIKIVNEQLNQKITQYEDAKSKLVLLQKSKSLIGKEEQISQSMLGQGIEAKVDFLKLQREKNDVDRLADEAKNAMPRISYEIAELNQKMLQEKIDYQNKAKQELADTMSEFQKANVKVVPLQDSVDRTQILSPVTGIIKQMFINTVGGVIRPGMDIVEIVPTQDALLIEAKIKPSDVAFIHPGQKSIVKFTAYDFSIYGGMVGEVYQISSDTIVDQQKQESYYLVKVKINQKNSVNSKLSNVKILPGMTVNVDIVTGKKTIMQYLLKPIIKARDTALTEK